MLNFGETPDAAAATAGVDDGHAQDDDVNTEPAPPVTGQEAPTSSAARMLELAAVTAERLITDAKSEAESLVTTARASADAILDASRTEAHQVATELTRRKEQQTAELERERATALAGLADEKAGLEAQIATLRQLQDNHRSELRQHLAEQLSLLDATVPEPPVVLTD